MIKNPDCAKYGCGEWKAPMITNPNYKGKWSAPRVDNPDYKGVWAPKKIENPSYFVDESPHAMAPIGGIGIELWTMQDGILFDNILLAHEASVASSLATKTFVARKAVEAEAKKALSRGNLDTVPDDVIGKVKHYGLKTMYYAQDNPAVVGGSVLVGLVPLILLCCYGFGGSSEKKKPPPKKASAAKSRMGRRGRRAIRSMRMRTRTRRRRRKRRRRRRRRTTMGLRRLSRSRSRAEPKRREEAHAKGLVRSGCCGFCVIERARMGRQ